jgi:hypothetical protein
MWYPPTGQRVSFPAEFVDRFSGGLLVAQAERADTEGLLRQLGHHREDWAGRAPRTTEIVQATLSEWGSPASLGL